MTISVNTHLLSSALAISLSIAACSKPTDNSELEEIKQELAELKKEVANNDVPVIQAKPEVEQPSADDIAFEKAKSDGRVRAFGKYAKDFKDGRHLLAADEGAWASAKRQNSVAAFEAYRRHFPDGKNVNQSYSETVQVQNRATDKALADLGYDIADFPSFGALSMDVNGKIEKAQVEEINVASESSSSPLENLKNSFNNSQGLTKTQCQEKNGTVVEKNGQSMCASVVEKEEYSSAFGSERPSVTECSGEISSSGDYCYEPMEK